MSPNLVNGKSCLRDDSGVRRAAISSSLRHNRLATEGAIAATQRERRGPFCELTPHFQFIDRGSSLHQPEQ
jgi:hypothetical protein